MKPERMSGTSRRKFTDSTVPVAAVSSLTPEADRTSFSAETLLSAVKSCPGCLWGALAGGLANRLPICTKAGRFGSPEALCQAVNFLAAQPRFQVKHSDF
jgi:hypothetical protein